jgi:hypothetical protein
MHRPKREKDIISIFNVLAITQEMQMPITGKAAAKVPAA